MQASPNFSSNRKTRTPILELDESPQSISRKGQNPDLCFWVSCSLAIDNLCNLLCQNSMNDMESEQVCVFSSEYQYYAELGESISRTDLSMNDVESEQVCIVLLPVVWSEYQYYIYTIDLAKHDSNNILPPIRISRDWPLWMAFTVKGGTLYMFGGHQCDDRGWETRSFSLELPPRDLSSPLKELREISKMNFPKAHPQAVWIKDRICVFSTLFAPGGNNFELYDPESNRWSTLPDPPLDFTKFPVRPESEDPWGKSLVKLSHFYVDGNNLFMDTEVGSFLYQSKASVWVECETGNLELGYGEPHVWVKGGDFLFSPEGRIVDGKLEKYEGGELIPPRKNDQGMRMIRTDYAICGLPKKSEKLRLCVVNVGGFNRSDLYEDAVLSLDLVAIDDQAKHTILKSLMFNLDDTIGTRDICIYGIFPLSAPSWIEQAQTQMELIFL